MSESHRVEPDRTVSQLSAEASPPVFIEWTGLKVHLTGHDETASLIFTDEEGAEKAGEEMIELCPGVWASFDPSSMGAMTRVDVATRLVEAEAQQSEEDARPIREALEQLFGLDAADLYTEISSGAVGISSHWKFTYDESTYGHVLDTRRVWHQASHLEESA